MKLENVSRTLLLLYLTSLGVYNVFNIIEGFSISLIEHVIIKVFLYSFFIAITIISLSLLQPGRLTGNLTLILSLVIVFAIAVMTINKNFSDYSILIVIVSLLAIFATYFPRPFSEIIRAVGLALSSVMTLALVTYVSGLPDPLLIPNEIIYIVAVILVTGYVISIFVPWVLRHVFGVSLLIVGFVGVVTGVGALQTLPPLFAARGLGIIAVVAGYMATTLLVALGVVLITYAISILIPSREGQQEERRHEIEIEPYTSDETKTR